MSFYFVEAQDKSFVNFKAYDTCTDAQKRSLELAELLDTPVCVFKSFSYPPNRDDAFLRWTAYPDHKLKYAEEDIGKSFDQQEKEMFKNFSN